MIPRVLLEGVILCLLEWPITVMRIAIIALTISEKIFKDGDIIIVEAPFTIAAINVIVIIIIISHTI